MNRTRFVLGLVTAASLFAAATARATTDVCDGLADGTPCVTSCRASGACEGGRCAGGAPRPDGTPCASGNACTRDDACLHGGCVAGVPVTCAALPCQTASCDPVVGCRYTGSCDPPDGGDGLDGGPGGSDGDAGEGDRPDGAPGEVDGSSTREEARLHVHGSGCRAGGSGASGGSWWPLLALAAGRLRRRVNSLARFVRRGRRG